jgi:dihydrofolate reductase / thymidylate synthase
MLNLILICDKNGGISKNGNIPWYFKGDLKYFKRLTTDNLSLIGKNSVIMGRKTWESLPNKFLKDRINIVLTKNKYENKNNKIIFYDNLDKAINYAETVSNKIWIIGGANLYNQCFNNYRNFKVYFNIIDYDFNCDLNINIPKNIDLISSTTISLKNSDDKLYNINNIIGIVNNDIESQYLRLLNKIMYNGSHRKTRNSMTYSVFSEELKFNLEDGFPLLTTKRMFWKGIVEELLFFIRGDTNTKKLEEKGVKIWKGNTTKEFLTKCGLDYEEGNMGPMYGYQWRNFNSDNIDQFEYVINLIKNDPTSRRIIMTDFNPAQVHLGVLYPCHSLILQFYVNDKKLSVKMYQRSADAFLGLPFNIASTSLLLCIFAKLCYLKPYMVTITLGDCHIYNEHIDAVKTQLSRSKYDLPIIKIPNFKNIKSVENSELKDYEILNYKSHQRISAKMFA